MFILILMIIPTMLTVMGALVAKSSELSLMKSSPFECGFEEFSSARLSFSLKFFLIVLIFLIFDVEIALLLPLPFSHSINLMTWGWCVKMMMLILLLGLYIEMSQGSLSWVE